MLATAKLFSAPSVKVKKQEKPQPKLFSDFVKGVKKNEVHDVLIKPSEGLVYYMNDDGETSFANYIPSNPFWEMLMESDANIQTDLSGGMGPL